MAWSILDVYTCLNGKVYIDLNPATFFEHKDHDPKIEPAPKFTKIQYTHEYNVAVFIEVEFDKIPDTLTIDGKSFSVHKPQSPVPIDLQLCLVFKNEWDRIPIVLEYYKRVHGVQRFVLYDNQSLDPPPQEILAREDTIYHKWDLPYKHKISDKTLLSMDYDGPEELIVAQNSAYSHCLKRYRDATWTALLDTDEFMVRRREAESLLSLVRMTSSIVHTISVRGHWAGCNNIPRSKIFSSLQKFTKRSQIFCMKKLILRSSEHVYTNCIHNAYPTSGKHATLAFERGYYFFHLYTASSKLRRCNCQTYCQIPDKSFQESFMYMK